ncbi:hypothetical protein OROHE_012741 [Orobanche hederae]
MSNLDVKSNLKVITNKQKTKVLYAEANSDFADVLMSYLTLSLGTIVRVLKKQNQGIGIGSLTTLYKGLENLNSVHFQTESCKQMLLNPKSSSEAGRHKLRLNLDDADQPTKYFKCSRTKCNFFSYPCVGMHRGGTRCDCGKSTMDKEISVRDPGGDSGDSGVYTMRTEHFIISDDLQIFPCVTGDVLRLLSNLGITDTDEIEQMDITFGFKESFLSRNPLTDIVLNKMNVDCVKSKYEIGTLVPEIAKSPTSNTKQFIVKAFFHESKNKILFVEADDNFVEFLCSLLTVPLGGIERLLGGSTTLKNIDNLYKSIQNINADKYLKTQGAKTMLLNPKLPPGNKSAYQIFPLIEEIPRGFYFCKSSHFEFFSYHSTCDFRYQPVSFRFPNGPIKYVTGPAMFMVTDDLIVTPLCATSSLSIFNRLKIPLSDVREMELNVGLQEALSILRASLTSTCALTDGLINNIINKQPKQEH